MDPYSQIEIGNWVAIDTETTGLSVPHGDRPFLVTVWSAEPDPALTVELEGYQGFGALWDGYVDWKTRKVTWEEETLDSLAEYLTGKNLVLYNAHFDLRMLAAIGITLQSTTPEHTYHLPDHYFGPTPRPKTQRVVRVGAIADAQLACHVFDNRGFKSLDKNTKHYLEERNRDETDLYNEVKKARGRFSREKKAKLAVDKRGKSAVKADYWMVYQDPDQPRKHENPTGFYGLCDVYRTLSLWCFARLQLKEENLWDQNLRQHKASPAFYVMENEGLPIHEKNLKQQIRKFTHERDEAREKVSKEISKHLGYISPNPNSDNQVRDLLYNYLNFPVVKKTDTGLPSANAATIERLQNHSPSEEASEVLSNLLVYRKKKKMAESLTSYDQQAVVVEDLHTGHRHRRLFGSFNQVGTNLTRCSSNNPNLQNIPARESTIRSIFGPPPGWALVAVDYSQVELRLFAIASQDPEFQRAYREDLDIHQLVAAAAKGLPYESEKVDRGLGKTLNFGIIYGAGEAKIISEAGNNNAWTLYSKKFPHVPVFMDNTIEQVKKTGEVRTLFGYRIWVTPEPAYKGVNCIVQGSAGDVIKEAMTRILPLVTPIPKRLNPLRLVAQVHDELVFLVRRPYQGQSWNQRLYQAVDIMESIGPECLDTALPVDAELHEHDWSKTSGTPLPKQ